MSSKFPQKLSLPIPSSLSTVFFKAGLPFLDIIFPCETHPLQEKFIMLSVQSAHDWINEVERPVQDLMCYNEQGAEPIVTSSRCVSHRFSYEYHNVKSHELAWKNVPA